MVHSPPGSASDPLPLVVGLDGHGGTGRELAELTALNDLADEKGFVAIYPLALANDPQWGKEPAWDLGSGPDADAIAGFVGEAIEKGCVDASRVYATGFSLGGGMSAALACRMADVFAAVASVAGIYGPEWLGHCNPSRPIPVVAFHGTADPVLHYDGGLIDAFGFTEKPTMAVPVWAADWAARNRCSRQPTDEPIGDDVSIRSWDDCSAAVVLYSIENGGHTWPGASANDPGNGYSTNTISATELMWSFFEVVSEAG